MLEKCAEMKSAVLAALAAAGSLLAQQLGGWDGALEVLVGMMAADYVTGLVVAGVFHRSGKSESGALDSRSGFQGLVRKGGILLLVYLGALLDRASGTAGVRTAVCLFFIANEGLSVLENLGLMGLPYPAALKNALEALGKKGGADGRD